MVSIPVSSLGPSELKFPLLGFGTAQFPFSAEAVKESIINAIEVGYRHFDTAQIYESEKPLGDAIADALERGLIKSRDELFITSKLSPGSGHSHLVLPALQQTLNLKPGTHFPFKPAEDIVIMDIESVWKAMEECQILGLTKSIGVSNFTCRKIEKLLVSARIPPAVNQVEMNPLWQQKKLRKFCEEKGIQITAFSPLGGKGTIWGSNRVLECEVLKEIASAKGKTVAQVSLRWVYEQGVSIVVKSFNKERMKENLEIFEWELSKEELQKINQIPQERVALAEMYVSDESPYKSLMELWDGEL
ncbi:non-functional NADPH-dependent codeinone reductase 2 isoform X2 [Ricinus communis]|uniref:non-functional NADPH-dependent codeinone reductase 2 isoform X2 n=1 Tax=Ricinus communis TaxID=3988 RepID=UPI00077297E7|nr:non-functional NADPH-dependent codeinone reductase 2 isoform X2 [Ricinus communis]